VLDPGGFGAVTITKSISITNDNSGEAGILASGVQGIIIPTAGIEVHLRGLVIDGAGTTFGTNGISVTAGASVDIQNCVIKNFKTSPAAGINFQPSGSAKLTVRDCHFVANGTGSAGGGIVVKPSGSAFATVSLTRVTLDHNSNGLIGDASATTGAVLIDVLDSSASGNGTSGFSLVAGSSANTVMSLNRVGAFGNSFGVATNGVNSNVLLSNSVVSANNSTFSIANSGKIISYLNNVLLNNFTNVGPTGTQTGQ
jgi:hypothetical protein